MTSAWTNARTCALEAAALGYPVFPLSYGKVPALRSPHERNHQCKGECGQFGHGVHDASADPDRVHALFASAPTAAGYGVACGTGRQPLVGLDLDRKNGLDGVAELTRIAKELNIAIPRTITVHTPSGGLHLWFASPANQTVPNSAGRVAPGIDVRGTAGYLVGPGSRGRAGRYSLAPWCHGTSPQPLPDALLPLLAPPKPKPAARFPSTQQPTSSSLTGLVRFVLDAGEGELNNRLYWAACRAFENDVDHNAVARALVEAAAIKGHPERSAARTVESARRAPARSRA